MRRAIVGLTVLTLLLIVPGPAAAKSVPCKVAAKATIADSGDEIETVASVRCRRRVAPMFFGVDYWVVFASGKEQARSGVGREWTRLPMRPNRYEYRGTFDCSWFERIMRGQLNGREQEDLPVAFFVRAHVESRGKTVKRKTSRRVSVTAICPDLGANAEPA